MNADPYATGVLIREVHQPLVRHIDRFAKDANISPECIWTPLATVCGPEEVGWVLDFKFHRSNKVSGLAYVGWSPDPRIEDRMAAIAGALIRNFINARVMTVHTLIDIAGEGAVPEASCLLIPNFFLGKARGGDMPPWKISVLFDALLERRAMGVQTVLYVCDFKDMAVEYGAALRDHLQAHYVRVEV